MNEGGASPFSSRAVPEAPKRAGGGLLLLDKPKGWTSHDVVAYLRRFFPRKTKVGHTGTLDPMATGLLVILVGKATKLAAAYQSLPKTYSGSFRLGTETDSGDMEGKVLAQKPYGTLAEEDVAGVLAAYRGKITLPVPSFSAVKHKGRPLYDYARKGEGAPEIARTTVVESFELTGFSPPEVSFRVACSSGTYIRALAADAGKRLGCGAVLSALRRESIGKFMLADAMTLEAARELGKGLSGRLSPLPEGALNA